MSYWLSFLRIIRLLPSFILGHLLISSTIDIIDARFHFHHDLIIILVVCSILQVLLIRFLLIVDVSDDFLVIHKFRDHQFLQWGDLKRINRILFFNPNIYIVHPKVGKAFFFIVPEFSFFFMLKEINNGQINDLVKRKKIEYAI